MAKPTIINTYTETRTHKDQKLEITINIYDKPIASYKYGGEDFYTHIVISHHGKGWGAVFLKDPVEEYDFKQAIEDVYNHIEIYKTK